MKNLSKEVLNQGNIISFLTEHIEEVKDYLRILLKNEKIIKRYNVDYFKLIDKITGFDYDGSDEDVTPVIDEKSNYMLDIAFNWAGSPSLEVGDEEPEVIKIGGKDIGVLTYN